MIVPIVGFAPDADPTTPGILTDCENLIPSERGMVGGPSAVVAVSGLSALAAECRGAAVLVDTTGNRRNFAGTQTKLYELTSSTWTDRSRAGDYTGTSENRWMFAQFGNIALATNDTEVIQFSASGAFADVTGAPKARIIVTTKNFVHAFDTNEGTFGDQSDRWWCSAFQDYSSWTPDPSVSCASARLIGVPGGFTAAAALGGYLVAYKERGMYLGQEAIGTPEVWQWDQVPGEVGCVGPEAVVDIGGAHIFVGPDNIWQYDGTRPVPIATGQIRQWFYDDISATYKYRTIVHYDRQNSRIWIFYPSASSGGIPDRAIVYSLISKRWGRANRSVEAVFQFVTPGLTWDTLNTIASTWDTLPSISWDSQSWQSAGRAMAIFTANTHTLATLTGTSTSSNMTTGDYGDDWNSSLLRSVRLRFTTEPTSAAGYGYSKATEGGVLQNRGSVSFSDGRFDLLQDDRWHRMSFAFIGDHEVTAISPNLIPTGQR